MIQRRSSAATKTPAAKKKSKRKNKRQTLALGGPQKSTLHTAVDNRPSLPSLAQLNNEGSNISALEDGQCLAWSANLKFVPERMGNLHACVQGLKRRPDIIAIQDPPLDFPFIAFPGYSRWYRADDEKKKEVTEEDKSTYRPYRFRYSRDPIPEKKEPTKLAKVAFLIHEALNGWSVSQPEDENRGIVATLHLETRDGSSIAFHNVYNHEKRLDVEALTEPCLDETKAHVLLGDFNLHHPLWGGGQLKRRNIEAKAKLLVEKVNDVNMICLNEPGIVTFSRGTQSGGKDTSVVDLVFVSEVITDQVQYKLLDKVKGFESDHRISTVAINLKMERKTGIRYVWRLTPEKKFQKLVAKELEKIDLPHLPDEHRTVEILDAVINKVLVPAIQEFVPVVQVYEPEVKVNVQPSYSTDRTKWGMPKRLAYTPDFQYLTNTYRSNSDKADCFVMATWTKARKKSLPRKSVPTASPDDETSTVG
ncbi:uncharacterized protein K460DRAFT_55086 [Cucurbitaria berberidis CBS 394.84]|uniref:Endonuclease/exonuclease/phosphatase domain-containing protein n=1 Tax=Cucurbitaria berberidis CBS 394.84 TaxID=1168544 RepID=A0A9P4GKV3_9PLEO|nr:uncharacterized protein K460DRAFT_55086 [Cucurbitaria berberidis CBS 394.84]KAF1847201.1 hypothetical protein K460DRAFT_55086 [Cucurbitaria berberidis CBS 394.84]